VGALAKLALTGVRAAGLRRLIILDEADSLPDGAQEALARLMKEHVATVAFFFSCNSSEKLSPSVQSMCRMFRFGKLTPEDVHVRLEFVCTRESVPCTGDGLDAVATASSGDLRRALNILEGCSVWGEVTAAAVAKFGQERVEVLDMSTLVRACLTQKTAEALDMLISWEEDGYSAIDLYAQLTDALTSVLELQVDGSPPKARALACLQRALDAAPCFKEFPTMLQLKGLVCRILL